MKYFPFVHVVPLGAGACARVHPHLSLPEMVLGEPSFFPTLEALTTAPIVGGNTVEVLLNGEDVSSAIRSEEIGLLTSCISARKPVRDALLGRVREYVKKSWSTLSRSNRDLLAALPDPKMPRKPGEPWLLYVSPTEQKTRVETELRDVLGAEALKRVEIRTLPRDVLSIRDHGLLYLPRPYVVPGGRFNEMYGWDSYFIQLGLLRDGELQLARHMTDNFLYEIARYGTMIAWAKQLGMRDAADLLQQTLDQEYGADRLLTDLAEGQLNRQAA